jgi:uncharacterized cupredoxin-like copper-binding protein
MRSLLVLAVACLLALSALSSGCKGGGEGGKDAQEVEDAVLAAAAAYADGDVEAFRAAFTDGGLAELFELSAGELDALLEVLPDIIGQDPPVITEFANTEVDGGTASTDATTGQGGLVTVDRFHLMKDGGDWIIDGVEQSVSTPDLDGYATADLPMDEFSFDLDAGELAPGKVAFAVDNVGEQPHEAILISLDDDVDLDAAIMSVEPPEGVEVIGGVELEPGESSDMVLAEELEAGRYALICFLPDTDDSEGTPHAFLGMIEDFRIE